MSSHWSSRTKKYGSIHELEGSHIPAPQNDWNELRHEKLKCKTGCPKYDRLMDGCKKGLLPGGCR